jgi:hypothetical protein
VVADCVLFAAEHPVRDLYAGGAGRMMALGQLSAPRLMDTVLARVGIPAQRTQEPTPDGSPGNLFTPRPADNRETGDFSDRARRFSLYTWLETRPAARAMVAGGLLTAAALLRARRGEKMTRTRIG